MNEQKTPSNTPAPDEAPPPGLPATPDDPVVETWLNSSDNELDLDDYLTLTGAKDAVREWLAHLPPYCCFAPVVFAATDGRLYTTKVDVVVLPATAEEVRWAVESAKEDARDMLTDRIEELDRYLSAQET